MKLFRGVVIAGMAAATVLAPVPASAGTLTTSCSDGGHNLNASQDFGSPDGAYHRWWAYQFQITGNGTGGESNVIIRLRANNVDKWSRDYNSVDQGQTYNDGMGGAKTLKREDEAVLFRGIFDIFGSDPSCNAYTKTV